MKAIIVVFLLAIMNVCNAEFIYLKSSGEFSAHSKIVKAGENYDRIVNLDNVSTFRKIGNYCVVIDGNINIIFKSQQERDEFMDGLGR